jgi:cell division septation protein DedD
VVVFTFAHKDDAARQAQALNAKHPGFDPEVFSPDSKGPYLIVLGGPMTRDEANRLRQKARSVGFPHDAYIQNFSH